MHSLKHTAEQINIYKQDNIMTQASIPLEIMKQIDTAMVNELTEYHIYIRLSKAVKDSANAEILKQIAEDELRHYKFWEEFTGKSVKPKKWKVFKFVWIARILGLTFGIDV